MSCSQKQSNTEIKPAYAQTASALDQTERRDREQSKKSSKMGVKSAAMKLFSKANTRETTKAASNMVEGADKESPVGGSTKEYILKKRRPGCTGMFWRGDPSGKVKLESNKNWPRDNATLRGQVKVVEGEKWLHAQQVKQQGGKWLNAPANAYMPFEYNGHYYLSEVPNGSSE